MRIPKTEGSLGLALGGGARTLGQSRLRGGVCVRVRTAPSICRARDRSYLHMQYGCIRARACVRVYLQVDRMVA